MSAPKATTPDDRCGKCAHYIADDERMGRCRKQSITDPVYGVIYGLAFASEGGDGSCDDFAPRAGKSRGDANG